MTTKVRALPDPQVHVEDYDPSVGSLAEHMGAFNDHLGLRITLISRERIEAHLECDERHHQPFGIVNGGVWCTIVETLGSIGAQLRATEHGRMAVGVTNTTDFLRSHRTGRVDAVGTPIHVGRSQQLWQIDITRATDGKLVARGQVRVQAVSPEQLPTTTSAPTEGSRP